MGGGSSYKKKCNRCEQDRSYHSFIEGLDFCKVCTTHEEWWEYIATPLMREMKGLNAFEKQRILKGIAKDNQEKAKAKREEERKRIMQEKALLQTTSQ